MTTKIAISVPDDVAADARRAVSAGEAASVSAYFSEAAARQRRSETLSQFVDDLLAEHGPPSAADYAWADEVLGSA